MKCTYKKKLLALAIPARKLITFAPEQNLKKVVRAMKIKYLFIALATFLFACTSEQSSDDLQQKIDSLERLSEQKDAMVNDFIETLNSVEDNLQTIREKENIVRVSSGAEGEMDETAKDRINNDILTIYQLLEENRQALAMLEKQMKKSGMKIRALNEKVAALERSIAEKNQQIEALRGELEAKNLLIADMGEKIENLTSNVDSLAASNESKDEVIADQTEELNRAWYVAGSTKELTEAGIIDKSGGFIGVGKIKTLKSDFNKRIFKEIDVTEVSSIPLYGAKKAEVLTPHPQGSYVLTGGDAIQSLDIKDAKSFWGISKYLVVVISK